MILDALYLGPRHIIEGVLIFGCLALIVVGMSKAQPEDEEPIETPWGKERL